MGNIKTLKPFEPGYDPRRNTKGRPKGSKNWRTRILRVLRQKVKVGDKMMLVEDVMIEQIFRKAMRGNLKAVKIIIDRIDGKVQDEVVWDESKPEDHG